MASLCSSDAVHGPREKTVSISRFEKVDQAAGSEIRRDKAW
jgi:hypothetical protein